MKQAVVWSCCVVILPSRYKIPFDNERRKQNGEIQSKSDSWTLHQDQACLKPPLWMDFSNAIMCMPTAEAKWGFQHLQSQGCWLMQLYNHSGQNSILGHLFLDRAFNPCLTYAMFDLQIFLLFLNGGASGHIWTSDCCFDLPTFAIFQ